jgi:hypothetical protein
MEIINKITQFVLSLFTAFVSVEITSRAMVFVQKLSYYRVGQAPRAAGV